MNPEQPRNRRAFGLAMVILIGICLLVVCRGFLKSINIAPPPIPTNPKVITVEQALSSPEGWGVTQMATSEPPNLYFALSGPNVNRISRSALGEAMLQARTTLGEGFSVSFSEEKAEFKNNNKTVARPYVRVICVRKWR